MAPNNISRDYSITLTENKVAIKNFDSWSISVYRKQKRLIIETLDYHTGPLTITRDELCDIARLMGLHVRKRKKKKEAMFT